MTNLQQLQEEMDKRIDNIFEEVLLDQEVRTVMPGLKKLFQSEREKAYNLGQQDMLERVKKVLEDYHSFVYDEHKTCIENEYIMLACDMDSRMVATKHMLKALYNLEK